MEATSTKRTSKMTTTTTTSSKTVRALTKPYSGQRAFLKDQTYRSRKPKEIRSAAEPDGGVQPEEA